MVLNILMLSQLCFSAVTAFYFYQLMQSQKNGQKGLEKESKRELEKLHAMGRIHLTVPLSEKTRPASFAEIRGQKNGLKALRAALCGENPQHVILYGPPGVGKTAAARAALSEAVRNPASPFGKEAKFVEMDATTLQYDERGIADPLIGSVHDPIYQGAGAYGPGGIPQPKAGAVTKAHGGILFLDEIGELPAMQLNKLLKVLEDRRVFFESAYYSRENQEIPKHIHTIFKEGLPADFRLVGATTRSPEELPPALRSRCTEIFFDALTELEILSIANTAAEKSGFAAEEGAMRAVTVYAQNGRDAVNMIEMAGSFVQSEGRDKIAKEDILWVAEAGRYAPRMRTKVQKTERIGMARGLAVTGVSGGILMDIEVTVTYKKGEGQISVSGAAETETVSVGARQLSRRGTVLSAAEHAMCFLESQFGAERENLKVHIAFPSFALTDGPSAGVAILVALYSALFQKPLPDTYAFTGEITPHGMVLPVGGIADKVRAAEEAGIEKVFLPSENAAFGINTKTEIIPTLTGSELLSLVFENGTCAEAVRTVCNFSPSA